MTAGEITAKPKELPQVYAKNKALFDELGKMWKASEAKYETYIAHTPCPFLINNDCSIYEVRPVGCRLFPNTKFGILTEDCMPLNRFKKQRLALKKGKTAKETYHFTGSSDEFITSPKFTEKQYLASITKLRKAGITDEELNLFNDFNGKIKK